jgi:hypothetical protein
MRCREVRQVSAECSLLGNELAPSLVQRDGRPGGVIGNNWIGQQKLIVESLRRHMLLITCRTNVGDPESGSPQLPGEPIARIQCASFRKQDNGHMRPVVSQCGHPRADHHGHLCATKAGARKRGACTFPAAVRPPRITAKCGAKSTSTSWWFGNIRSIVLTACLRPETGRRNVIALPPKSRPLASVMAPTVHFPSGT